jgi:uncharacterized protein (DUF885 family)
MVKADERVPVGHVSGAIKRGNWRFAMAGSKQAAGKQDDQGQQCKHGAKSAELHKISSGVKCLVTTESLGVRVKRADWICRWAGACILGGVLNALTFGPARGVRWILLLLSMHAANLCYADPLDDLARDFWAWRAAEQPVSSDDVNRIERPVGWVPDWSPAAIERYHKQLRQFEATYKKLDPSTRPVARQVDYRLMGSALARVRWELNFTKSWQQNPEFYIDQTLGAYFSLLLPPPPFDDGRTRQIIATLNSIPSTVEDAKKNLTDPAGPFARLALANLTGIRPRVLNSVHELKPMLSQSTAGDIDAAAERAIKALESFGGWLNERLPSMSTKTAVGRDSYIFFLKNVALIPFTPEQLLSMGQQEWARSVSSQSYEAERNQGAPQLTAFKDEGQQIAAEEKDELAIRQYLKSKNLLTVPAWMQHYRYQPMPAYLSALDGPGEADDFTGPSRLKENSTRYVVAPAQERGYFASTMAKDPRPLIVHEGVPGHYFQLALDWANPDPIRRHYYDSVANEGLGFYAEEMMMNAGLFDDSPHTREIIWNFMRLRALRVEVDVKLALGEFTMDQAADYLKNTVPMDSDTAHAEAAMFASTPGQAISYQIGKLLIYDFLASAQRQKGEAFNLRTFHDFLWQNGNVPITLQRWEYLGLTDQLDAADRLH